MKSGRINKAVNHVAKDTKETRRIRENQKR